MKKGSTIELETHNRSAETDCGQGADGVIVPCIQLSHIELGRINKDALYEVWHKHLELENLRARRSISLSDFEFCNGCEYINYCSGNCPALAYTLVGEGGRLPQVSLAK